MRELIFNINKVVHKFIFNSNGVLISNTILPINKINNNLNVQCCVFSGIGGLVDADNVIFSDSSGSQLSDVQR